MFAVTSCLGSGPESLDLYLQGLGFVPDSVLILYSAGKKNVIITDNRRYF